jgi:hypothetical protein
MWNIDEKNIKNCRCGTRTKSRTPWTEITAPKAQLGLSKSLSYAMITVLWLQPMSICALPKLTIWFRLICQCWSRFRIEFVYGSCFFVRAGWAISKYRTTGQHRKVGFQPNIGLGFQIQGIQVDYALTDLGNQSAALYSNIFSLK